MSEGPISIRRQVMDGKPCFAGTQVPVQAMFDWVLEGAPLSWFLAGHPELSHDKVVAVLRRAFDLAVEEAQQEANDAELFGGNGS